MKTIKYNPSWEWATAILLHTVENGETRDARHQAKQEILKMARAYDVMLAKHTNYFDNTEVDHD